MDSAQLPRVRAVFITAVPINAKLRLWTPIIKLELVNLN